MNTAFVIYIYEITRKIRLRGKLKVTHQVSGRVKWRARPSEFWFSHLLTALVGWKDLPGTFCPAGE